MTKHEENNIQPRYNVKLLVKDFGQKKGIDFNKIFTPVVKISFIRIVLTLVSSRPYT